MLMLITDRSIEETEVYDLKYEQKYLSLNSQMISAVIHIHCSQP